MLDCWRVRVVIFSEIVSLLQVARAGRFGTKGLAITFVSDEVDAKVLNSVQDRFEVNITELPDEIDATTYSKCPSGYTHMITLSVDLKAWPMFWPTAYIDSPFNLWFQRGVPHGVCLPWALPLWLGADSQALVSDCIMMQSPSTPLESSFAVPHSLSLSVSGGVIVQTTVYSLCFP